jgi:hypothetical protein
MSVLVLPVSVSLFALLCLVQERELPTTLTTTEYWSVRLVAKHFAQVDEHLHY